MWEIRGQSAKYGIDLAKMESAINAPMVGTSNMVFCENRPKKEIVMGITHTTLILGNPVRRELAGMEVQALAGTGAMHLVIPEHVALQLELVEQEKREVTLADGSRRLMPYVGPIEVRFGNRRCFVGAMVMGDEVLLGAIPMEDMDLVIRPMTRDVAVNPASPNVPSSLAKGCRNRQP